MEKIPENTMTVIKAVGPLFVVIILFIIVGEFGFGKIADIRGQIASAESDQQILTQKLDILRTIATNGTQLSNLSVTALPDSSPSLAVISQVKKLAGSQSLTVSQVKSTSPVIDATGLSSVNISFNIIGSRSQIESFILSVKSFAPIAIVDKIKLTEAAPGTALAAISLKSFWSPFPSKVPAVTTAIPDLTPAEQATLKGLSSLTQPSFSAVNAAAGGKTDPFSP